MCQKIAAAMNKESARIFLEEKKEEEWWGLDTRGKC